MTTEEIKRIVDDERAEQLTVQLCRHWEVATQRLDTLAQEVTNGMDTCTEAEIYAALMRMQRAVMALMDLNKIPTAFLFSEYLDRISQTISAPSMQKSVVTLMEQLLGKTPANKQEASFFDQVIQMIAQHEALPKEQQEAIQQQFSPMKYIFGVCAQHLKPEALMMVAQIIQNINKEDDTEDQEEVTSQIQDMRQAMETLDSQMSKNLQLMLIWLLSLMLLPSLLVEQPLVGVLERALRDTPRGERQQFVARYHDGRTHQGAHSTGAGAWRLVCQVDDRPQGLR